MYCCSFLCILISILYGNHYISSKNLEVTSKKAQRGFARKSEAERAVFNTVITVYLIIIILTDAGKANYKLAIFKRLICGSCGTYVVERMMRFSSRFCLVKLLPGLANKAY